MSLIFNYSFIYNHISSLKSLRIIILSQKRRGAVSIGCLLAIEEFIGASVYKLRDDEAGMGV